MRSAVEDEPELYPMEIPADQVEEVLADIDNLIKFKDFRYILQSDAVAVYRPFMRRLFHQGVFSEIMYATNTAHKRLVIYWPPEDKSARDGLALRPRRGHRGGKPGQLLSAT